MDRDKYRIYVEGGEIISKNDGDIHKVPVRRLTELYGLKGNYSIPEEIPRSGKFIDFIRKNIILTPDPDGRYNLNDELSYQVERIISSEKNEMREKVIKRVKNLPFLERLKFLFQGENYELSKI